MSASLPSEPSEVSAVSSPPSARRVATWLRLVALAEPLTLAVLLTNVSLLHDPSVAAAIGPVHGGCYLAIAIGFLVREGTGTRARLLAVLPGVGGLLAARVVEGSARTAPDDGRAAS